MKTGSVMSIRVTYMIFLLCWLSSTAIGQSMPDPYAYGNEWMTTGQDYIKIDVDRTGIYQIDGADLIELGIDISRIDPYQLRLYNNGSQIPIVVSGEFAFSATDYIYFYGEENVGTIDGLIYRDAAEQQLNPKYSLYSDQQSYFLSWHFTTDEAYRIEKTENNIDPQNLPPKENFYLHTESKVYHDFHFKPTHDGRNFVRYSSMDAAEGYGNKLKESTAITFELDKYVATGVDATIQLRFGTNVNSRNWNIKINDQINKIVSQPGYGIVQLEEKIELPSQFSGTINLSIDPVNSIDGKHSLAYVDISYPREYDFNGYSSFQFSQQPSIIRRLVEIDNFKSEAQPILFNLTQSKYLVTALSDKKTQFISAASFAKNDMILVDPIEGIMRPIALEKITVLDLDLNAANYLIITSRELQEGAEAYGDYRQSVEGGGHHVEIRYTDEISNQFGYGADGHPIGLSNYFKYLKATDQLPNFVFLIGKASEYADIRSDEEAVNIVPTFGLPGSDNMFVAFDNTNFPSVPIGRLAARNTQEVVNYLDKIHLHENPVGESQTLADQHWKKSIIHLSGGSADIQELIFEYLHNMQEVIATNKFGAAVTTFRKTSADPIQSSRSEAIIEQINQGASLISFFGHSAVGTFDFSLEDPSKYSNKGRNPVILSLGCHSGNIHTSSQGISEEFVLEKDNGATVFIASSGTAFITPQYNTGLNIYDLLGDQLYGEPIGLVVQKSLERRSDDQSLAIQTLLQQLTIHGDPAYKFNAFDGPDYLIDEQSVAINPSLINSTNTTFDLSFEVVNIGATVNKNLEISVRHLSPDGQVINDKMITIPSPTFRTKVELELTHPGIDGIGKNKIMIDVDPNGSIEESPVIEAESNNELITATGKGFEFFIFDNSAKPISPPNFGIVNSREGFIMMSSIDNAFAPGGSFVIEMDTTEQFDSPWLQQNILISESSIMEWQPEVEPIDGTVYYWRIAAVSDDFGLKINSWRNSSFVYLEDGPKGWNQSHYYQWLKDDFDLMKIDDQRNFDFDDRIWDIRIKNEILDPNDFWVFVNSSPWASLNPKNMAPALAIFIWDGEDLIFQNSGNDFGSMPFSRDGFLYKMDKIEDRKNIKELLDAVPAGAQVFMHTILADNDSDLHPNDWQSDKATLGYDLFEVLEGQGATKIRQMLEYGTVPYTFVFKKDQGAIVEDIALRIEETIDLSATARSKWDKGRVRSVPIGPVKRWMRLLWAEEKESDDQTSLNVIGIQPNGSEEVLKTVTDDYSVNLTSINPAEYPFIRLQYDSEDTQHKSSAQLKHWRVVSSQLPDAALLTLKDEYVLSDTVDSGRDIELSYDIANLTSSSMGPILIKYRLENAVGENIVFLRRSDGLGGDANIAVNHNISTDGLSGRYFLSIELNPNEDQVELTDCNNFGLTEIYIRPDNRNPFLNVTFDGRQISNGEKVGNNPEIRITLLDHNSFVLLDDPTLFEVKLFYPQVLARDINHTDDDVIFNPAIALDDNRAELIISPELTAVGVYVLEVYAEDAAGNRSGDNNYRISFEVEKLDESKPLSISPNPMNDEAIIEYVFTENELPDVFEFYIYAADGKSVKTFTADDFSLRKGLNTIKWDVSDSQGSPLSNGLYYYKLITNIRTDKGDNRGSFVVIR